MSEHENGPASFMENGATSGMSLRDYFAAKAMHAELVTAGALTGQRDAFLAAMNKHNHTAEEHLAFNAYKVADAMLREREKAHA